MSLKLKRVLYALALGLVFAVFCKFTEAGTPQINADGVSQIELSTATR